MLFQFHEREHKRVQIISNRVIPTTLVCNAIFNGENLGFSNGFSASFICKHGERCVEWTKNISGHMRGVFQQTCSCVAFHISRSNFCGKPKVTRSIERGMLRECGVCSDTRRFRCRKKPPSRSSPEGIFMNLKRPRRA